MTKNVHYLKVSQNLVYKMLLLSFTAAKAVGTIINLKLLEKKRAVVLLLWYSSIHCLLFKIMAKLAP